MQIKGEIFIFYYMQNRKIYSKKIAYKPLGYFLINKKSALLIMRKHHYPGGNRERK